MFLSKYFIHAHKIDKKTTATRSKTISTVRIASIEFFSFLHSLFYTFKVSRKDIASYLPILYWPPIVLVALILPRLIQLMMVKRETPQSFAELIHSSWLNEIELLLYFSVNFINIFFKYLSSVIKRQSAFLMCAEKAMPVFCKRLCTLLIPHLPSVSHVLALKSCTRPRQRKQPH